MDASAANAAFIRSTSMSETEILSVPVRLRRAGREIRMVIDGTNPLAASKPDARLIRDLYTSLTHP
jgi:hypothetical protein